LPSTQSWNSCLPIRNRLTSEVPAPICTAAHKASKGVCMDVRMAAAEHLLRLPGHTSCSRLISSSTGLGHGNTTSLCNWLYHQHCFVQLQVLLPRLVQCI
jgi:hypothetical protein